MPAATAKHRSANGSGNSRNPPEPPLRDRVEARLRELAAESQSTELADGAGDPDLAADTVYNVLAHQFASAHSLAMGLGAQAHRLLRDAAGGGEEGGGRAAETLRFAAGAARLMERCRAAALALERIGFPSAPDEAMPDGPGDGNPMHDRIINGYHWKVIAGRDAERRRVLHWLAQGKKLTDLPKVEDWPDSHNPALPDIEKLDERLHPPAPRSAHNKAVHTREVTGPNRGRLKNGNPSGDYLAAPRCGAKARAGHACRQPAMANGRCRFHGGKSTGPLTAEGRHRAQTARLTHGFRRAEIIRLRGDAARAGGDLRTLTHFARESLTARMQRRGDNLPLPLRERGQGERGLARGSATSNQPSTQESLNAIMEELAMRSSGTSKDSMPRCRAETPLPCPSPATGEGSFSRPSVTGNAERPQRPARFVPFVTLWCNSSSPIPAGHGVHRSKFTRAPSPAGLRHTQRRRLNG